MVKPYAWFHLRQFGEAVLIDCKEGVELSAGDIVILKDENDALDYATLNEMCFIEEEGASAGKHRYSICRKALADDIEKIKELQAKQNDVMRIIKDKIGYHNLEMKLIFAEYTFDASKLVVYFTAEERVDFRQLVRDMARTFKARIEMRQIGIRDGAKFIGGLGICGKETCCSRFLSEFAPMTVKMAKDQAFSLNPSKISGLCGRLMCCLSYEWPCYKEYRKGLPREGQTIDTPYGRGKVMSINLLQRKVTVEINPKSEDARIIELDYNQKGEGYGKDKD